MEHAAGGTDLGLAVALLASGVIAVPLFRLLGLGAVLGYLTAGVLVGPFALKLFNDPQAVLHIAEFGVVMFLFLIGLDMRPAKLWAMRRDIFGLGLAQVLTCGLLLSGVGVAFGLPAPAAVIGAFGFVLSSTAVIMKMMEDRGFILWDLDPVLHGKNKELLQADGIFVRVEHLASGMGCNYLVQELLAS